jgi:hypothetical protein
LYLSNGTITLPANICTGTPGTQLVGIVGHAQGVVDAVQGATAAANSLSMGGTFLTTLPTLTTGQQSAHQLDSSGRLIVSPSINCGAANGATGQVSVASTATAIVAARATRRSIKITNLGTNAVYIGFTSGVTITTGDMLLGTTGTFVSIPTNQAIWGITASTSVSVSTMEVWD